MRQIAGLLTICVVVSVNGTVAAEKVDMSPAELTKTATHIVKGKVAAIFERTATDGDWKYTRFVAEVRIAESEKGDGLKKGDLVYVRYWHRAWVGKGQPPPSTAGHRGLPADGETLHREQRRRLQCYWRQWI